MCTPLATPRNSHVFHPMRFLCFFWGGGWGGWGEDLQPPSPLLLLWVSAGELTGMTGGRLDGQRPHYNWKFPSRLFNSLSFSSALQIAAGRANRHILCNYLSIHLICLCHHRVFMFQRRMSEIRRGCVLMNRGDRLAVLRMAGASYGDGVAPKISLVQKRKMKK